MKYSIQKLAEEIFQAPSAEELLERSMQSGRYRPPDRITYLKEITELFPKGVVEIGYNNTALHHTFMNEIDKTIDWKAVNTGSSRTDRWFKGKWKQYNIAKFLSSENKYYIFVELK